MKILITLLLAFMFVSNVYAEDSSAHILGNGKVIYSLKDPSIKKYHGTFHIVYYKKQVFRCYLGDYFVECTLLKDNPVDRRAVQEQ